MDKKIKTILIMAGIIAGLAMVVFVYYVLSTNKYRNGIPELTNSISLSPALKEQISDALKKAHHNPSAKNIGELGMIYHSSANYSQAMQCYEFAAGRRPSDWKWQYYMGYLNMELGVSDKVIENFNRVIKDKPEMDIARYYLGEEYRNLGKTDLAEKAFLEIAGKNIAEGSGTTRIDHFPLGAYAMFQLSKIYFDTGRAELAEETLKKLIEQNELFGQAYRVLGNYYTMSGDVDQGEKMNTRANDLILYSPPVDTLIDKLALMSRSELYLLKKIDEATNNSYSDWGFKLVEHGLKYMPENEYLVSKAIEIYLLKNMTDKAIELADKHLKFFENNYNELGKMGTLFFQKAIYNEAKIYLTKAWELKTENTNVIKNLALSYLKTAENQKAQELLVEAAEASMDNPDKLADIAYAFIDFENKEKAARYLNILERRSPQNSKVRKLAGRMAEEKGNYPNAIKMYESSFKGDPKDVETINLLGDLLKREKMWEKYLNFYKEVLIHNPNNPEFLEKMSTFLLGCPDKSFRNPDLGLEYSKRAFINISSPPHIMLTSGKNLAVAYATKNDKKNALVTIKKTISISQRTQAPENVKQELQRLYQIIQKM